MFRKIEIEIEVKNLVPGSRNSGPRIGIHLWRRIFFFIIFEPLMRVGARKIGKIQEGDYLLL